MNIIELAHEAWPEEWRYDIDGEYVTFKFEELERFAALVRAEDEAMLRQALEMMEESHYAVADTAPHADVMAHYAVIEALRERLGVKE